MKQYTPEDISRMKLFDIVNHLNLTIHAPGGDGVLDFWIQETGINSHSIILDVACSTGFFSRYFAQKKRCVCYGIDIDPNAISAANEMKERTNMVDFLHYEVQDATYLHFRNALQFSHIVLGNALAFIEDKNRLKVINLLHQCLRDGGFLLVNSFFYKDIGDQKILDELASLCDLKVVGTCDYVYWNTLFEQDFNLTIEGDLVNVRDYYVGEDALRSYIKKWLKSSKKFPKLPMRIQSAFFERLFAIKLKANENHKYLDSKVQIWRKK